MLFSTVYVFGVDGRVVFLAGFLRKFIPRYMHFGQLLVLLSVCHHSTTAVERLSSSDARK